MGTGQRAPEVAAAAAALSFPAFPCAAPVTTRRYASPRSGAPDVPTCRGDAPAGPGCPRPGLRLREAPGRAERPAGAPRTDGPAAGAGRRERAAADPSARMLPSPRRPPRPRGPAPRGPPSAGPGAVRCGGAAELGELSSAAPASLPLLRASPVQNKTRKRQKVFVGALPGPRGRRRRAGVNPP